MDKNGTPSNLEEAIETLITFFEEQKLFDIIKTKKWKEDEFIAHTHPAAGQFIRNSWYLWWYPNHKYNNWPNEKPGIVDYFNELGIVHADDMSGIILTATYKKLVNEPFNLNEKVEYYQNFWREQGFKDGIPKMN